MAFARDFYGYSYDTKHPAFAEFVTGNPLDEDGIKKFVYHIATGRLLDADDLDAQAAEVGYTFSKNERRVDEAWLWKKAQIAMPYATMAAVGKPGQFNGLPPADLEDAQDITPVPDTMWVDGQYVILGDGSTAYWNGTEWVAGIPIVRPVITVTNGILTDFERDGVRYVQIEYKVNGSFTVSADVPSHNRALGAGGGTGGHASTNTYIPAGGGAGGLDLALDVPLVAGSYSVTIGAGGARVSYTLGSNSGSNSVLTNLTTSTAVTAIGGGYGAVSGTWNLGANGGSGGGARAQFGATGTNVNFGLGTAGQGNNGGQGNSRITEELVASGGGGGAGGVGGNGVDSIPGAGGLGRLLDWTEPPRTVCAGGPGMLVADVGVSTKDEVFGNGTKGAVGNDTYTGKGGDGFLFLRVRYDQANVVAA
jgi:hypothetical protein